MNFPFKHPTTKELMTTTPPPLPIISKDLNPEQNKFVILLFLHSFDVVETIKDMGLGIEDDATAMANAVLFMRDEKVVKEVERIRDLYTKGGGIIETAISMKIMEKVTHCDSLEDFANVVTAATKWLKGDTHKVSGKVTLELEDMMIAALEKKEDIVNVEVEFVKPKEIEEVKEDD